MTTTTGSGPGIKRGFARLVRLLFGAMFVVQTVGVAFALRRKRTVSEAPERECNDVALTSIFGPLEFTSTAQAFRGGTLTCLYGGGILDLRGAVLAPGGATLRMQAFNGGGQILIPASWRLETKVIGLGGVADARPRIDRPDDAPTLSIHGWAMFGGFGIAAEGPRDGEGRAFAAEPIVAN